MPRPGAVYGLGQAVLGPGGACPEIAMSVWRGTPEEGEIQAELDRLGFGPGDSFVVTRYDDGRVASINDANGGEDFNRPWGPERYVV